MKPFDSGYWCESFPFGWQHLLVNDSVPHVYLAGHFTQVISWEMMAPVSAKPTQFSFPLCHSFPAVSSKCAQLLITLWTCSSHLFANQGCYLAWCYKRLQRPPVKIYPTVRKISCWSSVCILAMPNAHNPVCSNTNLPLSILLSQVGNASELLVIQK